MINFDWNQLNRHQNLQSLPTHVLVIFFVAKNNISTKKLFNLKYVLEQQLQLEIKKKRLLMKQKQLSTNKNWLLNNGVMNWKEKQHPNKILLTKFNVAKLKEENLLID